MTDPHANQPLETAGAPLASAKAAVVLVHGRGADAPSILRLAEAIDVPNLAWLAPQATNNTWYPHRFIAPFAENEPYLSSALARVDTLIGQIQGAGIPDEHIALIGFSQGACLASEYAARNARRWGAIGALSGGLIGPPGTVFEYPGSLAGTPALVGCSDVDPHIPVERVHETTEGLRKLGAEVDERIYPGMDHTVNEDEVAWLRKTLRQLSA
ncbi:MAG: dienelactone hydrolase family protein [Halofilum sp. (in: g-proteobacteria)]